MLFSYYKGRLNIMHHKYGIVTVTVSQSIYSEVKAFNNIKLSRSNLRLA